MKNYIPKWSTKANSNFNVIWVSFLIQVNLLPILKRLAEYSFYLNGNRGMFSYCYFLMKRHWNENDLMSLHNNYACKGFTLWNIHIKTIHKGSFYLPFMNKETHIQSCKRTNKCIKTRRGSEYEISTRTKQFGETKHLLLSFI